MKKTLIALTLSLASAAAMASPGFYAGGDIGTTHSTQLSNGSTVGAFAGYEWDKNMALQLGYEQFPGIQNGSGNAHAIKLDGVLTTYFDKADTFGAFIFFGVNDSGVSGAGSGFGYDTGLGLRYNVSSRFDVRLQGEYLRIGSNNGYNINEGAITLGAAYHF